MSKLLSFVLLLGYANCKMHIDSFSTCHPNEVKDIVNLTVFDLNDKQYLTGDVTLLIDLGHNVDVSGDMFLKRNNNWIKLTSFKHMDTCRFFRMFVGHFLTNMFRDMGLPPGQCPIEKGLYHFNYSYIDVGKLGYSAFPMGKIKAILSGFLKTNDQLAFCLEAVMTTGK